jgi:hypothetical protein
MWCRYVGVGEYNLLPSGVLLITLFISPAPGLIPLNEKLTYQAQDISMFFFSFYESVCDHSYLDEVTSASNEDQGWWVYTAMQV